VDYLYQCIKCHDWHLIAISVVEDPPSPLPNTSSHMTSKLVEPMDHHLSSSVDPIQVPGTETGRNEHKKNSQMNE
jgi:hypothetical protein